MESRTDGNVSNTGSARSSGGFEEKGNPSGATVPVPAAESSGAAATTSNRTIDLKAPNGQLVAFFCRGARAIAQGRRPPPMLTGAAWHEYCKNPAADVLTDAPPLTGMTKEELKALATQANAYLHEASTSKYIVFPPAELASLYAWHVETRTRVRSWLLTGASNISSNFEATPMVSDEQWEIERHLPGGTLTRICFCSAARFLPLAWAFLLCCFARIPSDAEVDPEGG